MDPAGILLQTPIFRDLSTQDVEELLPELREPRIPAVRRSARVADDRGLEVRSTLAGTQPVVEAERAAGGSVVAPDRRVAELIELSTFDATCIERAFEGQELTL
jgi:hypothetical protein